MSKTIRSPSIRVSGMGIFSSPFWNRRVTFHALAHDHEIERELAARTLEPRAPRATSIIAAGDWSSA